METSKPQRGRPPHLPSGTTQKAYRVTPEEHAAIRALIERMRNATKRRELQAKKNSVN